MGAFRLQRIHLEPCCEMFVYPVFVSPNAACEIALLHIKKSGLCILDGGEYNVENLEALIDEGVLLLAPVEEEQVHITDVMKFQVADVDLFMNKTDFINEIKDLINELNEMPTSSDDCVAAYNRFNQSPTADNREQLKIAYERVPQHLAYALLSFDEKDAPIRRIVYGDEDN